MTPDRLGPIMAELGYPVADPFNRGDFTVTAVREAVLAYECWNQTNDDEDHAAMIALCALLAAHPHQPLGVTPVAVLTAIIEAVA